MAVQKQDGLHTEIGESAADLRNMEGRFAAWDANGKLVLCGAGGRIAGVISQGREIGKHTSLNTKGNPILRVVAGAAIAINARVCSDAAGKAVAGLTNSFGYVKKAVSGADVTAEVIPEFYDADGA